MIEIKTIQRLFPKHKGSRPRRLMAIFAHPDDESLNLAGVLAKASQENIKTYLVCLTRGERGVAIPGLSGERLKRERTKELTRASKILEASKIFTYDLSDGELFYQQEELGKALEGVIAKIKPSVVFTHDPSGGTGHPDHIATSLAVKSVTSGFLDRKINLFFVVLGGGLREIMKKGSRQNINWQTMPEPTHWLNIAPFVETKEKACLVHQSQRITRARPISLKVWYQLFDREYLYLVDLRKKYRFKFGRFETNCFKFTPPVRRTFFA